ncbi:MAG TPA: cytochrome c [Azospirillaceae bacterium]|nr:cytochrome c [Azospirillaceae bacterium]
MARRLYGFSQRGLMVAILAAGTFMVGAATAQGTDPAAQVEARQDQMKRLRDAMKTTGAFVKDGTGSAADVKAAAATISEVAGKIPSLFPVGTGVGIGDSEALPAVWENWDKFSAANKAMADAAPKLAAAADMGDKSAIGAAMKGVGASCSGCHDNFRVKK